MYVNTLITLSITFLWFKHDSMDDSKEGTLPRSLVKKWSGKVERDYSLSNTPFDNWKLMFWIDIVIHSKKNVHLFGGWLWSWKEL